MKVLVTGLKGFTGRYAKSELEQAGHSVTGLKNDLRDAAALMAEIAENPPDENSFSGTEPALPARPSQCCC